MKSIMTKLALSLTLVLGSMSHALAASIDYYESGPVFTTDAILVAGDLDQFHFIVQSAGTYNFVSSSAENTDTYGYIYSNTYGYTLDSDDDTGPGLGFCVDYSLLAGESITLQVQGFTSASNGNYTVTGSAGPCADYSAYTSGTLAAPASDSGAFGLPAILFTVFGLGAVRLRRFFA